MKNGRYGGVACFIAEFYKISCQYMHNYVFVLHLKFIIGQKF